MPPKKKFTKEQIVEAAFEIAKSEGMDQITIRKVADQIGSSIAPIYVNFTDVEELKRSVIKKIGQLSQQMIKEQGSDDNPFRDIGIASLQFAETYPVLFRDFVMKPNTHIENYDQEMGSELHALMKNDPHLKGFSDEDLKMILFKMRTVQTGLSIMVANGLLPEDFNMEKRIELLDSLAEDIVTATRIRKQKDGIR